MNTHAIYQKSGKGAQAISTRQHGLTPKQRSMLILVDGKRSFEELAKLAAMLGELFNTALNRARPGPVQGGNQ